MSAQELEVVLLPELKVEASAELVNNNFPEFKKAFFAKLEEFKYELNNDDDFKNAKKDIGTLKDTEDAIKLAIKQIAEGSTDVKMAVDNMSKLAEQAREVRLARSKELEQRDVAKKAVIIEAAKAIVDRPVLSQDMSNRIELTLKNKRSYETMEKASKSEANIINMELKASRDLINKFIASHGENIAHDKIDLELKSSKELAAEFPRRIERIEAEKKVAVAETEKKELEVKLAAAEKANKESTQEAVIPTATVGTTPQGNLPIQQDKPSGVSRANTVSGNHLDPRPAENTEVGMTAKQEMDQFLEDIPAVFAQFREKRLALAHPENQEKALIMSDAVNGGWKKFKASI